MPKEMRCMPYTMSGQKAYKLKDIAHNCDLKLTRLRYDVRMGYLKPAGKSDGAWYILQSELDRYLNDVIGYYLFEEVDDR